MGAAPRPDRTLDLLGTRQESRPQSHEAGQASAVQCQAGAGACWPLPASSSVGADPWASVQPVGSSCCRFANRWFSGLVLFSAFTSISPRLPSYPLPSRGRAAETSSADQGSGESSPSLSFRVPESSKMANEWRPSRVGCPPGALESEKQLCGQKAE